MREDAALLAEQKTGSVDPYVPVEYYTVGRPSDAGGAWVRIDNLGAVARIIDPLDYSQEPYGALATVQLHNEDSAFDAYDLRGLWIRIGWGLVCSEVNEVSYPPYLKCIGQDFTSTPEDEEDTYIIQCEGAWNILERFIATSSHFFNQADLEPALANKTGKEIADYILELAGLDLGADIETLDGKITTWKPLFDVPGGENGAQTMRRLLAMFKCVLVPRTDCMHLKFNQDGDAVDYTYKVPTDASYHTFISGQSRSLAFKPMKVHVQDKAVNPTFEGEYADPAWTADMGYLTWADIYGVVTSDADCVFIAEAEVARAKSNVESGWIFVPILNCLQELYDKVTATDGRGNTSGTGRVGGFYMHYRPGHPDDRQRYCCEIRLGGLQKTLPTNMQAFVDQLGIGITGGVPGSLLLPHSINPNILRQAMQKYDCDIVPDPTHADYTWQQVKWLAGTIKFADGTTLTIDAGTYDLTALGYADNPVLLYFIQGNSTLQHTDNWTLAVGKDRDIIAIVQRAEGTTAEDKASWDGHTGKLGVLNTRVLVAALILAGHIRAGAITTAKLDALAVTADKIAAFAITAGKLLVYPTNLCPNPCFDSGDLSDWTQQWGTGTWSIWEGDGETTYALVCDEGTAYRGRGITANLIPAAPGDILTLTGRGGAAGVADVEGRLTITFRDKSGADLGGANSAWKSGLRWYDLNPVTAKAPADTAFVQVEVGINSDATPEGSYVFSQICLTRSSQIIVQGTPGGARIEITPDALRAYKDAVNKSFELLSADGDAWFGGKLEAAEILTSAGGATEEFLIDTDVADGVAESQSFNLEKGKAYTVAGRVLNMTDGDRGFSIGVSITDSAGVNRARQENWAVWPGIGYATVTFFSGLTTGGTTPFVSLSIRNHTGGLRHFHGYIRVSRVL